MPKEQVYLGKELLTYERATGRSDVPGCRAEKDGVYFTCESTSEIPVLLLYHRGETEVLAELPFEQPCAPGGIYCMKVRLPANKAFEYNFRIGDRIVTDPYAELVSGRETFGVLPAQDPHSVRGVVLRRSYNWKEDCPPGHSCENTVMYQLHVRGFTMQKNSGVRHKGTFRGLQEKIPYLRDLGITQLRLMPCYEFEECRTQLPSGGSMTGQEERQEKGKEPGGADLKLNYWGYVGEAFYFAPKAAYAADPKRAPEEFRDLIRACHQAGLEVIMEFSFGEEADFCLIARCLEFWVSRYHVDGFAVMARDSVAAELGRLPLFSDRKLICTWFAQDTVSHRKNRDRRMLAESNDGFMNDCRRLLKGDEDCLGAFSARIRKNPQDIAVINYMAHHDGFTLADLVSYDRKHNEANGEQGRDGTDYNYSWNCGQEGPTRHKQIQKLRMQQQKNAFCMLLLAQGTPMILAGDEFGNSQNGNNNPYCHDSELSWTDWSGRRRQASLTSFVRQLIAYRNTHGVLHQSRELQCADTVSCGYPDLSFHGSKAWYGAFEPMNRHLGCMYAGRYAGESGFVYVAYNMHWEPHHFALPLLPNGLAWRRVMDTSKKESFIAENEQITYGNEKTFEVPPRTVVILETAERKSSLSEKGSTSDELGEDQRTL